MLRRKQRPRPDQTVSNIKKYSDKDTVNHDLINKQTTFSDENADWCGIELANFKRNKRLQNLRQQVPQGYLYHVTASSKQSVGI